MNAEKQMITLIAAGIPENNPDELLQVYEYMKTIERVPYPIIKELQTAGIPILETLSDILDMGIYEIAVTSRYCGIEFNFIEQAFIRLTLPGSKFNLLPLN